METTTINDKKQLSFSLHKDRSGFEYTNSKGQSLIVFDYLFGFNEVFYNDGNGYKEIQSNGSSSQGSKRSISCKFYNVPHYERYIKIYLDNEEKSACIVSDISHIVFGNCEQLEYFDHHKNSKWSKKEPLLELFYEPLPDWDKIINIVRDEDDNTYCFYTKKFSKTYDTFVIKNNGTNFIKGEITKWNVYRDGGTTHGETTFGAFYFPTPFNPELVPTLNGKPIKQEEIDLKYYELFNLKREQKTLEDIFTDKVVEIERNCFRTLEKSIFAKYGKGSRWASDEYKQKILAAGTVSDFEEFIETIK